MMRETEFAQYRFTIKEGRPGAEGDQAPVYLLCEPMDRELSIVGRGHLSLRLRPGSTVEDGQTLAEMLEQYVERVGYSPP